MKKFLILLWCVSALWACNNAETKVTDTPATTQAEAHGEEHAKLALNNGQKWKSDESTNKNVQQLQTITTDFAQVENKTMSDYKTVGNRLQGAADTMIKECKMQGADHEALHLWLEPLLENVKSLKNATSKNEGSQLVTDIDQHLKMYQQYFE